MNRVSGAQLKSALAVSAPKQVAAGGVHVGRAVVTFSGKQASAVWVREHQRIQNAGYDQSWYNAKWADHVSFKINYPALNDTAMLSRSEADLIAAYTLHETGHVLFTCNEPDEVRAASQGYPLEIIHPLANGLEDARMEQSVVQANVAKNAKQLFARLFSKLTMDVPAKWNPCDFVHSSFTLAVLAREALGNGNEWSARLLARIPEPKRALYAWAMEETKKAPMGYDATCWAYRTAVEFYKRWTALAQAQQPDEQPEQPPAPPVLPREPDDQDDEPDNGEDYEDKPPSNPPEPSQDDEDAAAPDVNPGAPADDADEDGDDSDDSDGGIPGDADEAEDGDSGNAPGDEAGDGDDDGTAEGEEGGSGDVDEGRQFSDQGSTGDTPRDAEPSIEDIIKRANKRAETKSTESLAGFSPCCSVDPIDQIHVKIADRLKRIAQHDQQFGVKK